MNCFQNSVSLIPITTGFRTKRMLKKLWIAFRIQYLWYQQQPYFELSESWTGCELLSEFSIFDTNNNMEEIRTAPEYVVNCFQNSVSLIPTTTNWYVNRRTVMLWIAFRIQYLWYQQQHHNKRYCSNPKLWIAFRIQYLWYQQQHICKSWLLADCCELLSEFSIFDTNNNFQLSIMLLLTVVNCFQNSVSLIPTTTMEMF